MDILDLLDRPIAFQRPFVALTGSITAALMLSQAVYWQRRCKADGGWWWKTREEWTEETGMTREEQEGARKKLAASGFWKEERRGMPAKLFFSLDMQAIKVALQKLVLPVGGIPADKTEAFPPTRGRETPQQPIKDPRAQPNRSTSESTSEIPPTPHGGAVVASDPKKQAQLEAMRNIMRLGDSPGVRTMGGRADTDARRAALQAQKVALCAGVPA